MISKWNIQTKLFLAHILLIILVILGMSIKQYDSQWELAKTQTLTYYNNLSQQLMIPLTLALSNNNYANLTLPSFIKSITDTSSLYYLELDGITDNSIKFQMAYSIVLRDIWRTYYPENFLDELTNKIKKLKGLSTKKTNNKKIQYLIDRAEEELSNYNKNQTYLKKINRDLESINKENSGYFDTKLWKLTLINQLNTVGKGHAIFIYDIKELANIQKNILQTIFYEFIITSLISIFLLFFTVRWVTKPIKELTEFISNDVKQIDPDRLPGLKQHDEIGILAYKFKILLSETHKYIEKIEEQASFDFLTQLYNRRYFIKLSHDLIIIAKRENKPCHVIMIDIDNFKDINDTYGHAIGDEVIKLLSKLLKANTRASDIVSRLGGEEFAIMLPFTNQEGALRTSENIRLIIEDQKLQIENGIIIQFTISLGISNVDFENNSNILDAIKKADIALYEVKTSGKNRVAVYSQ